MLIVRQSFSHTLIRINQGTLDPANAGAVDPKYKRVIYIPLRISLAPSANLEFNLKMMFINFGGNL